MLAVLKFTFEEQIPGLETKSILKAPLSTDLDPLEKKILTSSEMKKEETLESHELQKMKHWVAEEMKLYRDEEMVITKEVFAFQLRKETSFRWNPSK